MILFSHSLRIFRSVVLLEKRLTGALRPDHLQLLRMTQAAVISVSDLCSRGEQKDLSGPAVTRELETHGFDVQELVLVPDEREAVEDAPCTAAGQARLVVTTGGTGIAKRDVTPEATHAVCDRLLDGVVEVMCAAGREETPFAALGPGVRND
jgi:molybdenum cofactor synthesis domain-containing protein